MKNSTLKRVQRLVRRGLSESTAFRFLKDSESDALGDILVEKKICTRKELQKFQEEAQERAVKEIESITVPRKK